MARPIVRGGARFCARARSRARGRVALAILVWLSAAAARAETPPGSSVLSPWGIDIHAFVSQGFILSSGNNYLAKSKHGSPEFTEIGLNVSKNVTDQLRMGVQLFSRDLGPVGNYRPQFDWGYLDYRFWDWLGVRAGRTKIPFGLYNEINDVDVARVPVLLPQSVYPIGNRDALLAVTGAEIYGYVGLGPVGQMEYRLYGGTIFLDASQSSQPGVSITDLTVPYVFGGRLMWLTPVDGLQVGGSAQALRFDAEYALSPEVRNAFITAGIAPTGFDGNFSVEIPLKLWIASIEYAAHNLLLAAEYGRWVGEIESSLPGVIPNSRTVNERFYGMASYQVTPWFAPGVYYSMFYPDVKERHGRAAYQHDVAATLRFDLTRNWLLKLEGHFMQGTAGLDDAVNRSLNQNKPLNELASKWGVFLIKTTAYF